MEGGNVVYFWGHTVKDPDKPGKACFSQWYPAQFMYNGTVFGTAEHWMMWNKARLFGTSDDMEAVLSAQTPKEAKALGRSLKDFDSDKWGEVCSDVVYVGNLLKFTQNPTLLSVLLGTGTATLAEASPLDAVWGIGICEKDALAGAQWKGLNLLGEALMRVRATLSGIPLSLEVSDDK